MKILFDFLDVIYFVMCYCGSMATKTNKQVRDSLFYKTNVVIDARGRNFRWAKAKKERTCKYAQNQTP